MTNNVQPGPVDPRILTRCAPVAGEVRFLGSETAPFAQPFRGPFELVASGGLRGGDLSKQAERGSKWVRTEPIRSGQSLCNEVGSSHQSYSLEGPSFAGLVLWGGVHAYFSSERAGKHVEGYELIDVEHGGLIE